MRVINLSIGDPYVLDSDGTDAVSQAVDNAVSTYGKVVAAAAGNSGDMPTTINPPGVAALALTVGAAAEWSAPAGTNRDSRGIY
ncbi:MAG: S8 family serine peptidase, partial [Nitriliruptorales bacterium]|nr:S8 family serine peptidase [Nitriliruptorales bacterium]